MGIRRKGGLTSTRTEHRNYEILECEHCGGPVRRNERSRISTCPHCGYTTIFDSENTIIINNTYFDTTEQGEASEQIQETPAEELPEVTLGKPGRLLLSALLSGYGFAGFGALWLAAGESIPATVTASSTAGCIGGEACANNNWGEPITTANPASVFKEPLIALGLLCLILAAIWFSIKIAKRAEERRFANRE